MPKVTRVTSAGAQTISTK